MSSCPCSPQGPPQSCPGALSYLGDLHTPVEQVLGADVVLVLPHVVQQAAVGHQLRHQLHRGGQADAQQSRHVGAAHPCHHIGLLWAGGGSGWAGAAASSVPPSVVATLTSRISLLALGEVFSRKTLMATGIFTLSPSGIQMP